MTDRPLHELTAAELAAGYRSGAFSPRDAIDAVLARLDAANPAVNAVITIDASGARRAAEASSARWRAGAPLSPIDGIPISVKDNLAVAGMRATWGSRVHADFVPEEDEPPIARLRAAGAILFGKTNVPEFTLQGYTDNLLFGVTRNPLAPDRTPGGSTGGGAAAVAAGIGPVAIGTDGGGSTRRPAAYCGLWGLKPSLGAMPRWGGLPQILYDFEVVGPIARSAADIAAVFGAMRGWDARDPRSAASALRVPSSGRPVIGFMPQVGSAPVDPRIAEAARRSAAALADLGYPVEEVAAPYDAGELAAVWTVIAETGLAWHLAKIEGWRPKVGANAVRMADAGAARTANEYLDALAALGEMRRVAGEFFARTPLMLSPATAALAWPADKAYPEEIDGKPVGPRGHAVFSAWPNLVGACGGAIPVALTPEAGGIGMQIVAAAGRDDDVLAVMQAWEAAAIEVPVL